MGIRRLLRRLVFWPAGVFAATFLGVVLQTALVTSQPFDALEPVDSIVCLGAGMDADGTLHHSAITRVETCVDLYSAGNAQHIHFTGGRASSTGPSAGEQMALLAQNLGVDRDHITTENRSQSTLQNALFSQPMIEDAKRIRIVTEGFHLPRSYASFAVMGDQRIYLSMSEPVRLHADGSWNWSVLMRETLAIWFNAARLIVWWVMGLVGTDARDAILA